MIPDFLFFVILLLLTVPLEELENPIPFSLLLFTVIFLAVKLLAVTEIPFLTAAFGTAHLSLREWLRLGILAAFPLLAHELMILFSFDFVKKGNRKHKLQANTVSES